MPLTQYDWNQLSEVQVICDKLYRGKKTLCGAIEEMLFLGIEPTRIMMELHEVQTHCVYDTQRRVQQKKRLDKDKPPPVPMGERVFKYPPSPKQKRTSLTLKWKSTRRFVGRS